MTTLLASSNRKLPRDAKRRVCFPITSRAYYDRSQLLIKKLHAHPDIDLELMLGGSIMLDKYSRHIADEFFQLKRSQAQSDAQLGARSAECSEMLDRVLKHRDAAPASRRACPDPRASRARGR